MCITTEASTDIQNESTSNKEEAPPRIPVTILSGFLGSGKTTLMQHILTSKDHQLKVAVIVNDMAELNIDGQTIRKTKQEEKEETAAHRVVKTKKEVVTLENGCICCTLRGDLIREIHEIQQLNQFDYILIESTGIAEPQQVAESFCVDPETQAVVAESNVPGASVEGKMLWDMARLDTCVTVVDTVNFPQYLSSLQRFQDVFQDGLDAHRHESGETEEGEKSISQLMMEQVEFANVILLNKVDLLASEKDLQITKALIHRLNPKARVITASYGKIDLHNILNTHLFDMTEAQESPGWLQSLKDGSVTADHGEADEYGVTSFVYRARKPFHPQRLYAFLSQFFCTAEDWKENKAPSFSDKTKLAQEKFGSIMRSKGTCWIAGRDNHEIAWAQTGQIIQLKPVNPWYCNLPQEEWEEEFISEIQAKFHGQDNDDTFEYEFGDRRQEIVIIGTAIQESAIVQALDNCLLTEQEMNHHGMNLPIGAYPDLIFPLLVPCHAPKTIFMIARHGQNHLIKVFPGFQLQLQHFALNMLDDDDEQHIKSIRVWLDKSDSIPRQQGSSLLLATLRPEKHEQQSLSITILPTEEEVGEEASNHRLRIQVVPKKSCPKQYSIMELSEICEVHIMAAVEPLPFQDLQEEDEEEETHDHDCGDATCPL